MCTWGRLLLLVAAAAVLACHCECAPMRSTTRRLLDASAGAGVADAFTTKDLVAAIRNPDVHMALLHADVTLDDASFGNTSILLTRNFTILGAAPDGDVAAWPVLDMGYVRSKIEMAPGVIFNISHLVCMRFRALPLWQAPGVDLFAPHYSSSIPVQAPTSACVVQDSVVIFRGCLPDSMAPLSTSTMPRPSQYPGPQQSVRFGPEAQSGCTNSTAARLPQRCWPAVGSYDDYAMYSAEPDIYGKPLQTGYTAWLHRVLYKCEAVMPEQCVRTYGPTGCYNRLFPNSTTSPNPPSPSLPSPPPPQAPADSGNGSADSGGAPLGAILGGVLGGVALLAVVVIVVVLAVRQRRRRSGGSTTFNSGSTVSTVGITMGKEPPSSLESRFNVKHVIDSPAAGRSARLDSRALNDSGSGAGGATEEMELVTPGTPRQTGIDLAVEHGNTLVLSRVVLGKGAYGRVVEGMYQGARVAVKVLDLGLIGADGSGVTAAAAAHAGEQSASDANSGGCIPQQMQALQQEVAILARCDHPNIIRLLAANLSPQRVCLVMELMDTSLDKLLHGEPGTLLPLPKMVHIMSHVGLALAYLHPTVLHRDIKPANILIGQPDSPRPVVKLADFGLGRFTSTALVTRNPEAGTAPYMAPELFDLTNPAVTDKADMFSFGVLLWECLSGERPWKQLENVVAVAFAVSVQHRRPPLDDIAPERRSPRMCRLLMACWQREPARRPAAAEAVKMLLLALEEAQAQ